MFSALRNDGPADISPTLLKNSSPVSINEDAYAV